MKENVSGLFWEIEVRDKDGKVIEKKSGKGNCVLSNWIRLFCALRNPQDYYGSYQVVNTLGNPANLSQIVISGCSMLAPSGVDIYGIVVGSGSTYVSLDDYQLASKIPHGTGSGQLVYGETSKYDYTEFLTSDHGVQRSFDNNSGADITINEIGLIVMLDDGNANYYVLIARDVISATTVPNGGRLTVKYWFRWNP